MRYSHEPEVLMRLRTIALALLFATFAAAQSREPKRAPDVPYVPTSGGVVEGMLKLAGVKNTDVVYDLGRGDGRIVVVPQGYGNPRQVLSSSCA
jgi:hypothetical protein